MSTQTQTAIQTWSLDAAHTSILFHIDHMVISQVTGRFSSFSGEFTSSSTTDVSDLAGFVHIDVASVNTESEQRDGHLKSAEFFDVAAYPDIRFAFHGLRRDGNNVTIDGQLTIRGTQLPITLKGSFKGTAKDPWGATRAAFSLTGKIHRKDYGLTWNQTLDMGGVLVGEDVRFEINAQLVAQ